MRLTDTAIPSRQIAFIDTALLYWEVLAAGLPEGVEVVLLDPAQDGLLRTVDLATGQGDEDLTNCD